MPEFDENTMRGFIEEMEKQALTGNQVLGLATGTGAALGGLWQGGKAYREAKQQGASTSEALQQAGKKGLIGAGAGAAIGGGLGGISKLRKGKGLFTMPKSSPIMGGQVIDPGKSLAEFGGHVGHIWTGKGNVRSFGGGAAPAIKAESEAAKALEKVRQAPVGEVKDPRFLSSIRGKISPAETKRLAEEKAQKALTAAQARAKAMERAEKAGLTSIPGTLTGIARDPRGTAGAFGDYIRTMSGGEKAFALGFPAAFAGMGALAPEEGQSRLGGALSGAASSVPWMMPWMPKSFAMTMLPGSSSIMPQMALGRPLEMAGSAAGNAATSGYRRVAGAVQPPEEQGR